MPAKRKTLQQEVAEVMSIGTALTDMTAEGFDAKLLGESLEDEDDFLGNGSVDTHATTATEEPVPATGAAVEALRPTVGALVEQLLMDPDVSYEAIVARVVLAHPGAKTTARSVASTASVLRKKGASVPMRRKGQA